MNRYRHLPTYRYYDKEGKSLTLEKSVGKDLRDYKVYGNSVQESDNLIAKENMISGYLPLSGAYPTTSTDYPNSWYQIIDIKAGQTFKVTYTGDNANYGRIRYIDNDTNEVVGTIGAWNNTYWASTASFSSGYTDGTITAKKDFKLGVIFLKDLPSNFNLKIVNTTPSPDTPIEIKSVGNYDETTGKYIIPVTISGNLIRHTTLPATSPFSVSYNENTNSYSIQGTLDTNNQVNLLPPSTSIGELKAGESLTFAIKRVNGTNTGILRITVGLVDSDGKIEWSNFAQLSSSTNEDVRTFTVTKNVSIKYLRFYGFSGDFDIEVQTQILKGSYTVDTLPSYEPYKEPITTNIYLNEPLRKIEDYADCIDFKKGKVIRNIKEVTFTGSEAWRNSDNNLTKTFRSSISLTDVIQGVTGGTPLMCNKLTPIKSGTSSNDTENVQFSSTNLYIRVLRSRLSEESLTGVKEWITNNNLKFAYPLATPIEETIELPTIPTYKGTNIIEVDTKIQPNNVFIQYYK